ncbi:MAG: hypothetical protein JJ992_08275, partial [Planctomycetes bacterium]|nr:hypothetical protein [Planctomycetota bacterium]
GPVMIVFFHELTRPGFGLMRAIANFAGERKAKGMTVGVVFLSDDATETTKWALNLANNQRLFSDDVIYGVSPDGKEGPGAYGLNRNVTLTILVGTEGKVTANFALVQPQLQADGPAILKAIAAVTGGGEIPSVDELETRYAPRATMQRGEAGRRMAQRGGRAESDPQLGSMLRAVINKQASDDAVREAAAKVEAYIAKNESARRELARIVNTVVNSGKLENYGTSTAQEFLRTWHDELSEKEAPPSTGNDDKDSNDRKDADDE